MSSYGKLNLLVIFGLPVLAAITSVISFGPRGDTIVFVFGSNAIPMLIGGLISALLLRAANKSGKGHAIALWPTLIPAALAAIWYLYGALISTSSDAGREYMALPFYLIAWTIGFGIIAAIVRKVATN
ncbi:MAG: hypothetical protein CL799_08145 [Chromatiales bacterium]|nr:hypothetical protein [Chromatiales bacterium]MDP6150816.1 hypothetical protein [Gammaproteobacteria bacterium]MDP7093839.1 hypothetical protein [Gammaproteobacteria bacterium]MDP7271507.1 hypothetical protein [Gammaproteobacteria bacterium]HJP05655.1 hypothetical protein [Gammaproteobacteria bacterium]